MIKQEGRRVAKACPLVARTQNYRVCKVFELFVHGLDKEADMASGLLRAMFGLGTDLERSLSMPKKEACSNDLGRYK